MKQRVDVIIPTYNRAKELRQALESLTAQTFRDFSVIVVDDGSTDETESVVRSFESLLKLHYVFQPNSGLPAVARNVGLAISSAEIVAFLDSDDSWKPLKLELSVDAIDSGADLVFHDLARIETKRRFLNRKVKSRSLRKSAFLDLLLRGNAIPNSSVVLRRKLIDQVGKFDESREVCAWEDYELWLRIANGGATFHRLKSCLGFYRDSPTSLSSTIKSLDSMTEIQSRYFLPDSELPIWMNLGIGAGHLHSKEYSSSRTYLLKAVVGKGEVRIRGDRLRALLLLLMSFVVGRSNREAP